MEYTRWSNLNSKWILGLRISKKISTYRYSKHSRKAKYYHFSKWTETSQKLHYHTIRLGKSKNYLPQWSSSSESYTSNKFDTLQNEGQTMYRSAWLEIYKLKHIQTSSTYRKRLPTCMSTRLDYRINSHPT